MKLSDLQQNKKNPRKITDKKLNQLKESINRLGDLSGIIWNSQLDELTGGNQRQKILDPDAEIQIIERYETPTKQGTVARGFVLSGGEKFNYREVRWDESTHRLATIAANKHGAEWDEGLLQEQLLELDALNMDLELTGFDLPEIEDKFSEKGKKSTSEVADKQAEDKDFEESQFIDDKTDYLTFVFDDREDFKRACEMFGVGTVAHNPSASGSKAYEMTGLGRIIDGRKLFDE